MIEPVVTHFYITVVTDHFLSSLMLQLHFTLPGAYPITVRSGRRVR